MYIWDIHFNKVDSFKQVSSEIPANSLRQYAQQILRENVAIKYNVHS